MGKKKRDDVIVFHQLPYCRHGLPYFVLNLQFFFFTVTQFSAPFTSRPWIHGSTIVIVLVPAVVIDPWFDCCGLQRTLPAAS